MTGEEMIENLRSLDLVGIASDTIEENVDLIADLNAAQLAQGIRSDGSYITPEYKDITVELKMAKTGLAGVWNHVTLYDEGDHYRQLYAKVQGEDVEYGSHDEKSAKLQAKYDGDQRTREKGSIYGLTTDSKDELITSRLQTSWETKIEKATGLKFD